MGGFKKEMNMFDKYSVFRDLSKKTGGGGGSTRKGTGLEGGVGLTVVWFLYRSKV